MSKLNFEGSTFTFKEIAERTSVRHNIMENRNKLSIKDVYGSAVTIDEAEIVDTRVDSDGEIVNTWVMHVIEHPDYFIYCGQAIGEIFDNAMTQFGDVDSFNKALKQQKLVLLLSERTSKNGNNYTYYTIG